MRVLVTGASGFAGSHVVNHLLATTDWDIVTVDRSRAFAAESPRVHPVVHDLAESTGAEHLSGVTAVVHLAGASDVGEFLQDPATLFRNNVDTTLNLLEWAREANLTHFIQVSTNEVYGPRVDPAAWSAIAPTTPYSASKAAQEALCVAWWRSYGVPAVIVNTVHLFGEKQPSRRLVPTAVARLLAGEPIEVVESAVRSWTYVGDFASAIRHLLMRAPGVGAERPDRWHVAGPKMSASTLVGRIARHLGTRCEVIPVADTEVRPGHGSTYTLDASELYEDGWVPFYGFDLGLDRTIDYWRDRYVG